jgi:hypothetical protein
VQGVADGNKMVARLFASSLNSGACFLFEQTIAKTHCFQTFRVMAILTVLIWAGGVFCLEQPATSLQLP